ncbi:MAG: hypothetical protein MRZ74_07325 [Blautia sp.]|nr:hypothetical protein [Blautia sp.]MDY5031030.1 hypothetical protein [Blautia sp.]
MEKKSIREIISVIFKAVTLAMGVAVVALSCLGSLETHGGVTLVLCALLWLWMKNMGCSCFASL